MGVGFIGLGNMGLPMALNMARAGTPLLVWNRSRDKAELVARAGATIARGPAHVLHDSRIVFLMLANGTVIDEVLERGTPRFAEMVAGRTLVHMGTTAASYSAGLSEETVAAGGCYVEAPVSGSRRPAEAGQLVGMVAGPGAAVDEVLQLLAPVCATTVRCGEVPNATRMKLAVNLFLITQVTGLAEAFHFAENSGLDLEVFRSVLDSGPMASSVSRIKLDKLVEGDFAVQASISDVHYNSRLIAEAAGRAGVSSPVLDTCRDLFAEAEQLGHGRADMVAVLRALEARTGAR
ncbi:MAG: NAD(P)-dependent oxidoreductase [Terrabacter sp.]|nr:NAD(P)-dependent oxidoreductase [Terrabacter sp.]